MVTFFHIIFIKSAFANIKQQYIFEHMLIGLIIMQRSV